MSTSLEKIEQLRAELSGPPSADADGAELALRSGIAMMAPMLARFLPENPGDLDDLMERGAEWLLQLRSDDAPPVALAHAEMAAAVLELQRPPADGLSTAEWLVANPHTSDDR